jgi:hypothetical protein
VFARLLVVPAALVAGVGLIAAPPAPLPQSDLDAFMRAVLDRRDENWKKLQQYILDEKEVVQVRGPGRIPIWGEAREYTWFIKDGFFVRSPVKANGVEIPEDQRRKYEENYLRRARERDEREKKEAAEKGERPDPDAAPERVPQTSPGTAEDLLVQVRRPEFNDSAYFLKFKFEQGNYALVGRETFNEREVLRIEHYPERLFDHEQNDRRERQRRNEQNRGEDREAAFERMMNKVSLVTLWVDPSSHQIVKYTFDNVNMDFMPAAWLVRLTDLQAVMTMSQPFPDVWLPRDVEFYGSALLAIGAVDIRYRIDYHDYREAVTSARIKRDPGRP